MSGRLMITEEGAHLQLDEPQYGVACGQAGVVYDAADPMMVLGGGWITSAPTMAEENIASLMAQV